MRYALLVDPKWQRQASYAIELLLEGIGFAAQRVPNPRSANLIYSSERPNPLPRHAVWIRADHVTDWNSSSAKRTWLGTLPILSQGQPAGEANTLCEIHGDIVYSTYALVTGAFEQQQRKDPWGIPIATHSWLQEAGLLELPVVALYTDFLSAKLRQAMGSAFQPLPRWPDGKQYALILSHDIDDPFARLPLSDSFRRFRFGLARHHWREAVRTLLHIGKTALGRALGLLPSLQEDPNFCFKQWFAFERKLSTISSFYVAVTRWSDPSGNSRDVSYNFRHPVLAQALHEALAGGWEIGLHASIHARDQLARFQQEKQLLEKQLGDYRLLGLRHHYWALDPNIPERTLWDHVAAGFQYDTSFGLNDSPGFRRGMIWPFEPFDRERLCPVPLLEVPPTLMDGGIFYQPVSVEEGCRSIQAHLSKVFRCGGAAVLDWHLEQLNPRRLHGAGPALTRVLCELSADNNIFWASPGQLAEWWRRRRTQLRPALQPPADAA